MVWQLAAAAIGAIAGSRQAKKQRQQERESVSHNLNEQAKFAREGAAKYGFNPLTLMELGQPAGAGMLTGGGAPALASIDFLTDAIKEVGDIASGDKARRRAAEDLELDLARLKVDQARSGVILHPQNAADAVGSGLAPLGRSASNHAPNAGPQPRRFGMGENPIAPGRKKDILELPNSPGVFEIENDYTYGAVTVPGDSEPWGLDELATAAIIGGPQVAYNYSRGPMAEKIKKRWTPKKGSVVHAIQEWWKK